MSCLQLRTEHSEKQRQQTISTTSCLDGVERLTVFCPLVVKTEHFQYFHAELHRSHITDQFTKVSQQVQAANTKASYQSETTISCFHKRL